VIVFPFIQQITKSLSTPASILKDYWYLYPKEITFDAYKRLFAEGQIITSLYVTVYKTVLATVLTILGHVPDGIPSVEKHLPFRNVWTSLLVSRCFFGGGLIPSFLLIRGLGFVQYPVGPDPADALFPVLHHHHAQFFHEHPGKPRGERVDRTARARITILMKIILPISMPVIATVTLWDFGWPLELLVRRHDIHQR